MSLGISPQIYAVSMRNKPTPENTRSRKGCKSREPQTSDFQPFRLFPQHLYRGFISPPNALFCFYELN